METQSPYNLLQKLPDSRVELIRATLFTGGADECHTAVWKLPQGVVVCVAPHGLRCMHPNRYSNRCETIQPPSLMTAHMNSVSSEYPLWANLHSRNGRAIRTHLAPRPPPPRGGRRSISHPRRLRSGGGSRISPCAPVPTTPRLGKGNVSRGTQCALPLARLLHGIAT